MFINHDELYLDVYGGKYIGIIASSISAYRFDFWRDEIGRLAL